MKPYRTSLLLLTLALSACIEPAGVWEKGGAPELGDADLRVAYVGNSLTSVNDVPRWVQWLADEAGRSMAHASLTLPNYSLEDHWYVGTQDVLRKMKADVVVMQQGPSSLPENQEHLAHWAGEFATVIREAGGEPALYMVWPAASYRESFPAVYESYRRAAVGVAGLFVPAGQTWVEAWDLDPSLLFYSNDGFHQSALGALAAAMTIYAVLYDVPADSIPTLDVGLDEEGWTLLRAAVDSSLARVAGDTTAATP